MLTGFSIIIVIFCGSLVVGYDVEGLDEKPDWKTVIKKLNELQNTVNTQNARISFLEKRNTKPEMEALNDLEGIVNRQRKRISALEKKYQDLQSTITARAKESATQTKLSYDQLTKCSYLLRRQYDCEKRYSGIKNSLAKTLFHRDTKEPTEKFNSESGFKPTTDNLIRKGICNFVYKLSAMNELTKDVPKLFSIAGRLLASPKTTITPVNNIVAFYAYLSRPVSSPSGLHILIFDTIITNSGNAFHFNTGVFIAPHSGLYVFTWTIRMYGNAHHTTELLVSKNIVGRLYFNPSGQVNGSVSKTVVVHVNQGDDVFVRTGESGNAGDIVSDDGGKSSFAGWALM